MHNMISKEITFEDFAGNQVTDTYWFHLSAAEVTELAMSRRGLDEYLEEIIKTEDVAQLFIIFKELLGMAVGKPLNDRVFDKDELISKEFLRSGAYEEFFFELIQNPAMAAEFIKEMMPKNLEGRIEKIMASRGQEAPKQYTDAELLSMPEDQFLHAAGGSNPMRWEPRFLQIAHRRKSAA
jgi:hypothetical protein